VYLLALKLLNHTNAEFIQGISKWRYDVGLNGRGIAQSEVALEMLVIHRSRLNNLGHRIWSLVILGVWAVFGWMDRMLSNVFLNPKSYFELKI